MKKRHALALLFAFAIGNSMHGQLVFVPDTNLRNAINASITGAVDASGYIDTTDPVVLAATDLCLNITWSPVDLTGIEAFDGLQVLTIWNSLGAVVISVNAWPANLTDLYIHQQFFLLGSLPAFPSTLQYLQMDGMSALSSLPSFPAGLQQLVLNYLPSLVALPAFPATLQKLNLSNLFLVGTLPALPLGIDEMYLINMPNLIVLSAFPATLQKLNLSNLSLAGALPALPLGIEEMYLNNMPITTIPNMPSAPSWVVLASLNTLAMLPPMPATIDSILYLSDLASLSMISSFPDSCPSMWLFNLPALQDLPALPTNLADLDIRDCSAVHCLPALPNGLLALNIDQLPLLTCIPNIPPGLSAITWDTWVIPMDPSLVCTLLSSSCPPGAASVTGMVFHDLDADGVRDAGEPGYADAMINITPGGWMVGVGADGHYSFGLTPGAYSLVCTSGNPYTQSIAPADHAVNFTSVTDVDTLNDFGVVLQPGIQDLAAGITSDPARPGFDNTVWLTYQNVGTIPMDGALSFTFDASQSFISSSLVPDAQLGNTLAWNFTALGIGETRSIAAQLHTDAGVPIGTGLYHTLTVDPIATDQTPLDNSAALIDAVVGSYDPNDKRVSPSIATPTEVAAGLELDYTIRFQNTGTAPASRVIITDTLSGDLQWSTFEFVGSSHACTWYVQNGVAVFTFDPINLPDSSADEAGSHGYVRFHMEPVATLGNGAQVPNAANIYFDFNAPVITPPCVFTVDASVALDEVEADVLTVFPNPASEILRIIVPVGMTGDLWVTVRDATGRTIVDLEAQGPRIDLPMGSLPGGIYRVEVGDGPRSLSRSFVKQ